MKNLIVFGIIFLFISLMMYSLSGDEDAYIESIKSERKSYYNSLINNSRGPFAGQDSVHELNFFKPNPKFRVKAKVKLNSYPDKTIIVSTDGTKKTYLHLANLEFKLKDSTYTLALFRNENNVADYFLPFRDATNTKSTYGAGRYLPVNFAGETEVEIDFNRAFNPYCAYNDKYACPIPPEQNTLLIKIEAGEKVYKSDNSH